MIEILRRAKEHEPEIIADRRVIHRNPEIGNDLHQTTSFVIRRLREMGYEPGEICPCGVTATVGKKGKAILLRADMDALPVAEESGLEFRSTNGYSHACGHDAHTAMLLGAARLLKEMEDELEGTVKLMFQPDEEGLTGAGRMIEAGVLDNPAVDAALAIHVDPSNLTAGHAACRPGTLLASADRFSVSITGRGGHGAYPHLSLDPINVACHIYISLQEVLSKEIDPAEPAVLTICSFHSGSAGNVIPQTAVMQGSIRAFSEELREFLKRRLVEISTLTAEKFRTECTVKFLGGVPALRNDEKVTNEMIEYIGEIVGDDGLSSGSREMGSEDFALVAERVPSTFVSLGAACAEARHRYPEHHPRVIFDEEALHIGAAIYAHCAMRWLKNNKEAPPVFTAR